MDDQDDPEEEDKDGESSKDDPRADNSSKSVDLKLEGVLAEWVDTDRIETRTALVRAF